MKLSELKYVLDELYGFDISARSRKREYVYARKVFITLARDYGYNWIDMHHVIDQKHDECIYHYRTFHVVNPMDLQHYNTCIDYFNLPMEKIPSMAWRQNGGLVQNMIDKMKEMSARDLRYFDRNRLDVFLKKVKEEEEIENLHNEQLHNR